MSTSSIDEQKLIENGLEDLACWLIREQHKRREDGRGRPRKRIGTSLRKQFFQNLEWVWLDFPAKKLGSHTYNSYKEVGQDHYTGPFVEFVKAFCGIVARHIKAGKAEHPALIGLADTLRSIEANGVHVHDGLQMTGFRNKALKAAAEWRLTETEAAALEVVKKGGMNAESIATALSIDATDAEEILSDLSAWGLIEAK